MKTKSLFLVALCLSVLSCEKEYESAIVEPTLSKKLASIIDYKQFSKAVPYDFEIDWGAYSEDFSTEFNSKVYEFNIKYTSQFNPEKFHPSNPIKYTVLVLENEKDDYDFIIANFTIVNGNFETLGFLQLDNFTGELYLNQINSTKKGYILYADGQRVANPTEMNEVDVKQFRDTEKYPEDPQERCNVDWFGLCPPKLTDGGASGGLYIYVKTERYTDWYNDRGNGALEFQNRTYSGISYSFVFQQSNSDAYNNFYRHSNFAPSGGIGNRSHTGTVLLEAATIKKLNDRNPPYNVNNKLTGRANCAYEKLRTQNGNLYKKTIGVFIDDPKYDVTLTVGECAKSEIACTNGTNPNDIVIKIEDVTQPALELAATILHEGMHAEIYRYVDRFEKGLDSENRARIFQLYQYYKGLTKNKSYSGDPVTDAQHVYMAENYVQPIATAIKQLDSNKYPLEYYLWYGWEGLDGEDFKNKLSTTLKTKYDNYQTKVNATTSFKCN